jgi:hypothetical protein
MGRKRPDPQPAGDMGYLECCGVVVPIDRIHLEAGNIVFTGHRVGPVRAVSGEAAVVGPDGAEVARGAIISSDAAGRWSGLTWQITLHTPAPEDCHPVIPGAVTRQVETGATRSIAIAELEA